MAPGPLAAIFAVTVPGSAESPFATRLQAVQFLAQMRFINIIRVILHFQCMAGLIHELVTGLIDAHDAFQQVNHLAACTNIELAVWTDD